MSYATVVLVFHSLVSNISPCLTLYYSHEHIEILTRKSELLMFRQRDGPYIPTLRLLHKCERDMVSC